MRAQIFISGNSGSAATIASKLEYYVYWRPWNRYGFLYEYEHSGDAYRDLKQAHEQLKKECDEEHVELLNGLILSDDGKELQFHFATAKTYLQKDE